MFQFSLRALGLFVLAVSVICGLVGMRLERARRQAAALSALRRHDGYAKYDYMVKLGDNGRLQLLEKPSSGWPTWLVRWLGEDFLRDVVDARVNLTKAEPGQPQRDAWEAIGELRQLQELDVRDRFRTGRSYVASLRNLRQLRHLEIEGGTIQGPEMVVLDRLSQLETLSLSLQPLDGTAGKHIAKLPRLQSLDLSHTEFGDNGCAEIARCRQLRRLDLTFSEVTDRGAMLLSSLTALEFLSLDRTPLTDRAMPHLAKLTGLRELKLGGTEVSDQGLQALASHPSLTHLQLDQTPVTGGSVVWPAHLQFVNLSASALTDEGLSRLIRCSQLTEIWVAHSGVTQQGIKHFNSIRPDVTVR